MQLLFYILTYPFLWLLSVLPSRLFYGISDVIYILVFHVVGYRKKVVLDNLKLCFPEKEEQELLRIRKEFYKHMCDMFLEMTRTMNFSQAQLERHYRIINLETLLESEKHKSTLVLTAHYGNWEWSVILNRVIKSKGYAVYQKINNHYFDQLVRKIRSKWGADPIHQKETVRTIVKNEKDGIRSLYGIVADQSPQKHRAKYWNNFMGHYVPIFTGPEDLARKLDLAVYFARITKIKRGYYTFELVPITLNGGNTQEHEITDTFMKLTEDRIRTAPAYYLWTHRRWKHRKKAGA